MKCLTHEFASPQVDPRIPSIKMSTIPKTSTISGLSQNQETLPTSSVSDSLMLAKLGSIRQSLFSNDIQMQVFNVYKQNDGKLP